MPWNDPTDPKMQDIANSKGGVSGSKTGTSSGSRTSITDVITAISEGLAPFAQGGTPTFQPSPQSAEAGQPVPARSPLITPAIGIVGGIAVLGLVIWAVRSRK